MVIVLIELPYIFLQEWLNILHSYAYLETEGSALIPSSPIKFLSGK